MANSYYQQNGLSKQPHYKLRLRGLMALKVIGQKGMAFNFGNALMIAIEGVVLGVNYVLYVRKAIW
jgi:hypothetical protein